MVSNKLDAVLEDTGRNFQWDIACRNKGGRVIEILSEHTCQGMLQGYTLTGRTGLFPSYEAFLGIIHTMMVQYSKFTKMASETTWREPCGSLNYLETSTWTRQEHNGFSHQNPSFIGAVLNLKAKFARVYLPPDANCFLSTVSHCLRAKNYVNLMVGSKQPTPVWLDKEEADKVCCAQLCATPSCKLSSTYPILTHTLHSIASQALQSGNSPAWMTVSTPTCKQRLFRIKMRRTHATPSLLLCSVLVGIGVEMTFEVIAAAALLRKEVPALRVRVVNVMDLMIMSATGSHPHALSKDAFDTLFTNDRPIHFNYHGYPIELRGLLGGRPGGSKITIEGYAEEGTTTSPFDVS